MIPSQSDFLRPQSLVFILFLGLLFAIPFSGCNGPGSSSDLHAVSDSSILQTFNGTWKLDKQRSTAVDPWRDLSVVLQVQGETAMLHRRWQGSREGGTFVDSVSVTVGGATVRTTLEQWPDNRHLGAYIGGDGTKSVRAYWLDDGRTLATVATLQASIQQGETPIRIYTEYRISDNGDRLDVLELRSTRPRPIHYVFTRSDA